MNIDCIICSDLLQPSSEIHATSCGHVFHHICLKQWLERSKTCPQCRCIVTEKTIHRLYFNFASTNEIPDDMASLQSKMDRMQLQLRLKNQDVENYMELYHKAEDQSTSFRTEVEKLNDKIKRLQDKLTNLEAVELVISGSKEQVKDILRYNRDPASLSSLVYTLKRELGESQRKYRHQCFIEKQLQTKVDILRKQVCELTKSNSSLKVSLDTYKSLEGEKQYYKNKLAVFEATIPSRLSLGVFPNTNAKRLVTENITPLRNAPRDDLNSAFICNCTRASLRVPHSDDTKNKKKDTSKPIAGTKRHISSAATTSKLRKLELNKKN